MNTPLSWIKAYVPELDCTAKEYVDAMTLSGTKVESVKKLDENLDKIVVGKILEINRHPDADKLVITKVQIDEQGSVLQIVTGAKNVKVNDVVPVVLDGGRVAGGHDGTLTDGGIKIKKGKLRGIESDGMMCAIEELGSTRDLHPDAPLDGVYIFSDNPAYRDLKLGADAIEALGLRDVNIEYEITSNRVDCFGVIGIAREAAATFGKKFVFPEIKKTGNSEKASDMISVDIQADDLCSRYCGRIVKNIKLAPSPLWMQHRLAAEGIRPINNIVDITNYVMEEFGQPMHAYDLDTVSGGKIIVRRAFDGEKFTTLDSSEHVLDKDTLMICDAKKPIGIAGIMGGKNSMITDSVKTMLFEAAAFDGTNIRLTQKRLGIRTDAAAKFEKGLCPDNAIDAINRACALVEELGAGEVVGGTVDVYKKPWQKKHIKFDYRRTNEVLGTDIEKAQMIKYFKKLEFEYDESADEVIPPTFRQDINEQCDLDEEVARFFGYANIPTTLPGGESMAGKISFKMRVEDLARNVAEEYGFSEAQNYSFESAKVFDRMLVPEADALRNAITIRNPLGPEFAVMRTISLNGILASLSTNYNRKNKNVRLFEIANVYIPKALPLTELPDERKQFTLGFYGDGDFFELKGVVEEFLERAGVVKQNSGKLEYIADAGISYLHPYRQAKIMLSGKEIGYLGQVHPKVLKNYSIGDVAFCAVIDMPAIYDLVSFDVKFTPIVNFPAVSRDLSLVAEEKVSHGTIESIIRSKAGEYLESVKLFDIYSGGQIQQGFKSMAYTISFRAKDRTLNDADITTAMNRIIKALEENNIKLRSLEA